MMMSLLKKGKEKLRHICWTGCRRIRMVLWRRKLKNRTPSILSNNCTAGVLYSDFGLPFASPTINMFMEFPDF